MKEIILISILMIAATCTWAADVKVCQTEKAKYNYRIELANLILSKTASQYGPAKIIPFQKKDPTQARCIKLLEGKMIDVVYLPATEERLRKMDAIKTDIHNGMLGYRVFLINKNDKEKFSKVKTINDLRKFKGGFGSHWGDYKSFALNKLPVIGVAYTHGLLSMLSKRRFDYFHRGLHEAWTEIDANREQFPDLIVEESLALIYDFPVYFMFNQKNQALKKRFKEGFGIILKDGSFRQLYKEHFGHYAKKANIKNRTLIRIKHTTPKGLPEIDTNLWLN